MQSIFQNTGFTYSLTNCLYASLIDKIVTSCNCSASFAAMSNKAALDNSANLPVCEGPSLVCMESQASVTSTRQSLQKYLFRC